MSEFTNYNSEIISEKSTKRRSQIATNAYDLANQAIDVAAGMIAYEYKLKRFTPEELKTLGETLQNSLIQKEGSKSQRSSVTMNLNKLMNEGSDKMGKIKIEMLLRFPKAEAVRYYGQFGIVYEPGRGYVFPKKYEEFQSSIKRMQEGIQQHGIESADYGLAYWQDLQTRFEDELRTATSKDTTSSVKVGETQKLRAEITRMLRSVILLVQAEEPEDYERILRNMGFRREKLA